MSRNRLELLFEDYDACFTSDVDESLQTLFEKCGGKVYKSSSNGPFGNYTSLMRHQSKNPRRHQIIFTKLELTCKVEDGGSATSADTRIAKLFVKLFSDGEYVCTVDPKIIEESVNARQVRPLSKFVVRQPRLEEVVFNGTDSEEFIEACALPQTVLDIAQRRVEDFQQATQAQVADAAATMGRVQPTVIMAQNCESPDGRFSPELVAVATVVETDRTEAMPASAALSATEDFSSHAQVGATVDQQSTTPPRTPSNRHSSTPSRKRTSNKAPTTTKTSASKTPASKTPASKTPASKTPVNKTPASKTPHRSTPRQFGEGREHPVALLTQLRNVHPLTFIGLTFEKRFPGYGSQSGRIAAWSRDEAVFTVSYGGGDNADGDQDPDSDDDDLEEEIGFNEAVDLLARSHSSIFLRDVISGSKENTSSNHDMGSADSESAEQQQAALRQSPSSTRTRNTPKSNTKTRSPRRLRSASAKRKVADANTDKPKSKAAKRTTPIRATPRRRTLRSAKGSDSNKASASSKDHAAPQQNSPKKRAIVHNKDWSGVQDEILKSWFEAIVHKDGELQRMYDILLRDQFKDQAARQSRLRELLLVP